jgi:hypothetical protein
MRSNVSDNQSLETRFIASHETHKNYQPPRLPSAATPPLEGNIKVLLSETVNYGHNAAVFFDVELKDGSLTQISVAQLFTDREFLNNCSRELYGHLCRRKGYMMGR